MQAVPRKTPDDSIVQHLARQQSLSPILVNAFHILYNNPHVRLTMPRRCYGQSGIFLPLFRAASHASCRPLGFSESQRATRVFDQSFLSIQLRHPTLPVLCILCRANIPLLKHRLWGLWACAPPQKGYLYRSYHDGATSQSLFWTVPVMSKVSSLPTTSPPVQRRTFHSMPAPLSCSAVDMLHRGMYLSESLHALLEYLERHIGVSEIPDSCPYLYSAFAIRNLVRSASFFPLFPLISGT